MSESESMINPMVANDEYYILRDESGLVSYKNKPCIIMYTSSSIIIKQKDASKTITIETRDVIGASCVNCTVGSDVWIYRYCYPASCLSGPSKFRRANHIKIHFNTNPTVISNWVNVINAYSAQMPVVKKNGMDGVVEFEAPKQRKYLLFVNPHSGSGTALRVYTHYAKEMFEQANIDIEAIVTTHANHAKEFVTSLTHFDMYDGVVTIGGDGILSEVVNGISHRADGKDIFKRIALIPIPGGTGNGLVKSILFESDVEYSILNAIFTAIKGSLAPLDMSLVTTKSLQTHYSFLILGWGLISDIDILSETMRYLGELRLYVAAVYYMIKKKKYNGKLSMMLANDNNKQFSEADLPGLYSPLPIADEENSIKPNNWITIEGSFVMIWVVQTSHAAISMYSGPGVTLADGMFTIYVVQDMTRSDMLSLLFTVDSGEFVKHPKVATYKARAYRLEPLETEKGLFTMDGEVIEYGPIQSVILPSYANVLKK